MTHQGIRQSQALAELVPGIRVRLLQARPACSGPATLLHNEPSRKILVRAGFQEIGVAGQYLQIAGQWQDHLLHQLILHA